MCKDRTQLPIYCLYPTIQLVMIPLFWCLPQMRSSLDKPAKSGKLYSHRRNTERNSVIFLRL